MNVAIESIDESNEYSAVCLTPTGGKYRDDLTFKCPVLSEGDIFDGFELRLNFMTHTWTVSEEFHGWIVSEAWRLQNCEVSMKFNIRFS